MAHTKTLIPEVQTAIVSKEGSQEDRSESRWTERDYVMVVLSDAMNTQMPTYPLSNLAVLILLETPKSLHIYIGFALNKDLSVRLVYAKRHMLTKLSVTRIVDIRTYDFYGRYAVHGTRHMIFIVLWHPSFRQGFAVRSTNCPQPLQLHPHRPGYSRYLKTDVRDTHPYEPGQWLLGETGNAAASPNVRSSHSDAALASRYATASPRSKLGVSFLELRFYGTHQTERPLYARHKGESSV